LKIRSADLPIGSFPENESRRADQEIGAPIQVEICFFAPLRRPGANEMTIGTRIKSSMWRMAIVTSLPL
jgi:hypothetical protein